MVYSKTELFDTELQSSAEFFKALAHPARLAILKYLAATKTCIIGDIADELPLSRTTVNQHLKELKDAELIVGTIEGAKTCYCLNFKKVKEMERLSNELFRNIISSEPYCNK
jgi:DNA-binding transcriptional ArsR family regulator